MFGPPDERELQAEEWERYKAEIARLRAENENLKRLLREYQYSKVEFGAYMATSWHVCVDCENTKEAGCTEYCEVAQALAYKETTCDD